MNTKENNTNIAAPSVTIAPRNPSKGILVFVVTITTHKSVQSYPCRSKEKAIRLASRFIASIVNPIQSATKQDDHAENPYVYNGPPRTAEQAAA